MAKVCLMWSYHGNQGAISLGRTNFVMVACGPDKDNLGFLGRPPSCIFEMLPLKTQDLGVEHFAVLVSFC